MGALLDYLKRHHLAALALFVALGGTTYAAVNLPKDSVGAKQIKTNAVGPGELKAPLSARIRTTGLDQTVTDFTPKLVSFDQVVDNKGGVANLDQRPTSLLAKRDGLYLLQGQAAWTDTTDNGRVNATLHVRRPDGTQLRQAAAVITPTGPVQFLFQNVSAIERLDKGQQVTLTVFSDTGQNESLSSTDSGTWLSLTYLGK